jgi:hypothetical protein
MFSGDNTGPKCFKPKILSVTYCAPRIFPQNPANPMIPIDQGGGGTPLSQIETAPPRPDMPRQPKRWQEFSRPISTGLQGFPSCDFVSFVVNVFH